MSLSEANQAKGQEAFNALAKWWERKEGQRVGSVGPEALAEILTDFLTDFGLWYREEYGEWPAYGDFDFIVRQHWEAEVDNYDGP